MNGRRISGLSSRDLTDRPVSGTIVPYDLGQPVIAGFETQHGFHLPTHPCSPLGFRIATMRIRMRRFSSISRRAKPPVKPIRNRNELSKFPEITPDQFVS